MNYNKILNFLESHNALGVLDSMPSRWVEALIAVVESKYIYYMQRIGQTYTLMTIDRVHFDVSYVGEATVCFQWLEYDRPCITLTYAEFQKTWSTDTETMNKIIKALEKEENSMEKTNVEIEIEIKANESETKREVEVKDISQFITKVISDPVKKITVVIFMDGKKEVVKCAKEDEYDVYVGVSLALSRRMFGTNGVFRECVDEKTLLVEPKKKKEAKKPEPKAKPKAKKGSK